jgi:hypothetical protein
MPVRAAALLAAGLSLAALPAVSAQEAQERIMPAAADSWQDVAGGIILYFVNGRTLEEATGPSFNPFEIDAEALLYNLNVFFLANDYTGSSMREGEVSILAGFNTPLGAFAPSARTPAIIPFAMMKNGECLAGYVAGYPVPDTTYAVDMGSDNCHAVIVEEIVYAQYVAANPSGGTDHEPGTIAEPDPDTLEEPVTTTTTFNPADPLDIDLDVAVWAAYNAAFAIAMTDPDYLFVRDGNFATLRDAILLELQKEGLTGIAVAMEPVLNHDAALGCAPAGTTKLRIAFSAEGLGISLVAASARSVSTYRYDPDVSYDLDIRYAHECKREGMARARAGNVSR